MIRSFRIFIINLLLLVTFIGCKHNSLDVDISDIDLNVKIHRFDKELFAVEFDSIDKEIASFYANYGDFFDVFNVHVINIGAASQKYYGSYLSMFLNDPYNLEVYEYTQNTYFDLTDIEQTLSNAFKRYVYHYPDSIVPEIVGYVSRFNHKLFTVGNYIGVGLDQYLGSDCKFYDMLGTPEYMQYNMYPEKIPTDIVNVWGSALYPYNDSIDNVLNRMIYNGLLLYFTDALLPEIDDKLKIGFSPEQVKFCLNNEKQMWTYLIEHKLLFETNDLEIRKLVDAAPSTVYFPDESPGRASVWIGWQIVRGYVKKHPEFNLNEIMSETDYQKILDGSKYNP